MVRFLDQEYARFLTLFEESGLYSKPVFAKAGIFNQPFRVVKTDKEMLEYVSKLTQFYFQFRAIGVNYNQIMKHLHTHFSEKAALSMLYKLEKITTELTETNKKILELLEKFKEKWLQNK